MGKAVVTVYDSVIASEFTKGGRASSFLHDMQEGILRLAVSTAPSRTGELKASHRRGGAIHEGAYRLVGSVYNISPHAEYVHDGTLRRNGGWIYPKRGEFLILPASRGNHSNFIRKRRVRGQRAQPWLRKAGESIAAKMGGEIR